MLFSYHNEVVPAGLWKTLEERKGKCCFRGTVELDFLLELRETQRRFHRKETVDLSSNGANLLQRTIVFHLITQLVHRIWSR